MVVYLEPLFSLLLRITLLCLLLFPFLFDFTNRFVPSNNYLIFPENLVIFYSLTGETGTWFQGPVCDTPRFMPYSFICKNAATFFHTVGRALITWLRILYMCISLHLCIDLRVRSGNTHRRVLQVIRRNSTNLFLYKLIKNKHYTYKQIAPFI